MNSDTSRRISPVCWIPTAYFAMGLPFVVVNMVAVLMLQGMGADNASIAFWTSLILLPWTLKPLWSPMLEIFGTKKLYLVATQLITGVAFAGAAFSLQSVHFFTLCIAFLAVVALSGATHDIACDGVYMSELTQRQQSKYIGWQGAFYNIAKVAATGGLVYLSGQLIRSALPEGVTEAAASAVQLVDANREAWGTVMFILAAVMCTLGLWHIFILPSGAKRGNAAPGEHHVWREMWEVLREFFTKKYIWLYLLFIVLYRFGEGFVVKIVPLFLKAGREVGGLGLDNEQIGLYYGTFGAAAFVLGSLLAGYYISARGLRRSLLSLVAIFNVPFVVYVFLAIWQPEAVWMIATAIVLEYFGYGFGFVGLTLFMMQQVAPGRHQMAHYAFASGIMNLGVMLPGMISGWLSEMLGYTWFFVFVMIATVPAFVMALRIPFIHPDRPDATDAIDATDAALTDTEGTPD